MPPRFQVYIQCIVLRFGYIKKAARADIASARFKYCIVEPGASEAKQMSCDLLAVDAVQGREKPTFFERYAADFSVAWIIPVVAPVLICRSRFTQFLSLQQIFSPPPSLLIHWWEACMYVNERAGQFRRRLSCINLYGWKNVRFMRFSRDRSRRWTFDSEATARWRFTGRPLCVLSDYAIESVFWLF